MNYWMPRAALLLGLMTFLAGCETVGAVHKPPACPVAGPEVAQDFQERLPIDTAPAAWDYLGRLKNFCDQIDIIRQN
jgi:hypothetical protein